MNNEINFSTFLFINTNKLIINVKQKNYTKPLYQAELDLDKFNKLNSELILNFLDNHIFKIEKLIKNFIKSIYVILDTENLFSVQISIKKNNYGNKLNFENLNHSLSELKDQCKKTLNDEKIIHMIINNYQLDDRTFKSFPENLNCKFFSLDVTFICLSNKKIIDLEKIFKKYHISVKKIVSAKYVKDYFKIKNINIFEKSEKIIEGCNKNEVRFIEKVSKSKGFFVKFFDFFN